MPARVSPIDANSFAAIKPRVWYPLGDVARLFGISQITARRRARSGAFESKRHPLDSRKVMVLGASILSVAGPLVEDLPEPRIETPAQRKRRSRRAIEDIARLKKKPASGVER